jgi:hypothetical protein
MAMKFIIKSFLAILFIPVFLLLLLAVTFKFQLLDSSFWQKTFSQGSVYSNLSASLGSYIEEKVTAEGGSRSDAKIFTDLVSPENLKDVIDKNLAEVLTYLNGESKGIIVYVPLDKVPPQLLPQKLGKISQHMALGDFLREFNMGEISPSQIASLSSLGRDSWYFLALAAVLTTGILILLLLLVDTGGRFVAAGTALVISGVIVVAGVGVGRIIFSGMANTLLKKPNITQEIVGSLLPPIALGILNLWVYFGAAALVLGIVLFFIKKPYYNKPK